VLHKKVKLVRRLDSAASDALRTSLCEGQLSPLATALSRGRDALAVFIAADFIAAGRLAYPENGRRRHYTDRLLIQQATFHTVMIEQHHFGQRLHQLGLAKNSILLHRNISCRNSD